MKTLSLALASTALAAAALSCASVTVDIDQVGSNVIVSSTGSINLAGTRSSDLVYALDAAIGPSFSDVGTGTQFTFVDGYFGPSQFGRGSGTYADFGAGDPFAFSQRDGANRPDICQHPITPLNTDPKTFCLRRGRPHMSYKTSACYTGDALSHRRFPSYAPTRKPGATSLFLARLS